MAYTMPMQENTSWLDCDDGTKLFLRRWKNETEEPPIAALLIVHGMAEHSLRYRRLAEKICSRGFEVWAGDMRGHGQTADLKVNKKNKGGLRGHTADKNGFFRVVADLRIIMRHIAKQTKKDYKGIPLFIMGHSWGSFLVQGYIEKPALDVSLKGCILSGTRGPGGAKISIGARFLAVIALLNGSRRSSRLIELISVLPYNKPFKPNRTPFDWISRDEAEVDAFIADPFSAHRCSAGFYRDMISGLAAIHRKDAIAKIDPKLPVYLFCGSADPVGDMGSSPTKLVGAYSRHCISDIEFVMYPEARHETINETNRDEVAENILNWLIRRVKQER